MKKILSIAAIAACLLFCYGKEAKADGETVTVVIDSWKIIINSEKKSVKFFEKKFPNGNNEFNTQLYCQKKLGKNITFLKKGKCE